MKTHFLLALALFAPLLAAGGPKNVKGYVYQDDNRNGVFDKTEKGIPGVAVSNGREVVLTDRKGRYQLPVTGPCEIFVIKPAGYATPTNRYGISQSYYLYRPEGSSTRMKYPGIAPTGELPSSVDFPLYPQDEPEDFRILVFGDPQCRDRQDAEYFGREVIQPLMDSTGKFAFGVMLGDIAFNQLEVFEPVMQRAALLDIPWYPMPGNHDHNQDKDIPHDSLGTETYMDFFGPATYALNYGKVHLIITDDIILPNPTGKTQYIGGLTEKQLAFIENDLRFVPKDHLVIFAGHIQLFDTNPNAETFRHADRQRLFDLLAEYPHTLSLSAHTHYIRTVFFDEKDGWKGTEPHLHLNAGATCADWYKGLPDPYGQPNAMMRDGSPQGYFTLEIDGNRFTHTYHPSRQADFYQMSLAVADSLHTGSPIALYANFYNGNERCEVSFRIDQGEWMPMKQTVATDPTFTALNKLWNNPSYKLPGRKVSGATKTYHLWQGEIPAFSTPGVHVAEVRATDLYGRTYTEKLIFEVL